MIVIKGILIAIIGYASLSVILPMFNFAGQSLEHTKIAQEVCLQLHKDVGLRNIDNCIHQFKSGYQNGTDFSIPGKQDRFGRPL